VVEWWGISTSGLVGGHRWVREVAGESATNEKVTSNKMPSSTSSNLVSRLPPTAYRPELRMNNTSKLMY
jgi:hypothetical protein